eukprot:14619-Heterococcus_DN1.PRE.4
MDKQLGAGSVKSIKETTPGPGLHNRHFKYTTTDAVFFCKAATGPVDNFQAEMASLQAIRECGCLRAPEPYACGDLALGGSYLLMEHMPFIPFGQSIPDVLKQLAEGLACMHLKPAPASYKQNYGFTCDGFLGAAPQSNEWEDNFVTFFLEQRLIPQYERAAEKFSSNYGTSNVDSSALLTMSDRVFEAARVALEPIAHASPSLLHGDLWIGNAGAITDSGTRVPAVFDPACWYGHHEFDLALASLFGGFAPPYSDVYFSIMPKADGFDERMRIFKLYHLLNHLNLHGAGFGSGGSSEEPQGYLEKVVNCMLDITGDSSRKRLK